MKPAKERGRTTNLHLQVIPTGRHKRPQRRRSFIDGITVSPGWPRSVRRNQHPELQCDKGAVPKSVPGERSGRSSTGCSSGLAGGNQTYQLHRL